MLHIYNEATLATALARGLSNDLRDLLLFRIASIGEALAAETEWLVIEPGDAEGDIVRAVGFSPLIEPIDGIRYPAFEQGGWDWLFDHGGRFEMQFTFGSTFACLLIVEDVDGVIRELRELCRRFAKRQ